MSELLKWLIIKGLPISVPLIFVIFLFLNPEKFEHWAAIFYRCLYFLTSGIPKIKAKIDKRLVSSSIQDTVNGVCERFNKEAPDILPHALKIEWVKDETKESFIKSGKAIVRLKHYMNQDRNIVNATLLYLKVGLLPRSKIYLDDSLRTGCEFKVANQIFLARHQQGAYEYFVNNELSTSLNKIPNLKEDLQILEDIDSVGYFSRVFLMEVKRTGDKLLGTLPTPIVQEELRNFFDFIHVISKKAPYEDVPLRFHGAKIKAHILLLAKKETISLYGIMPYVNAVKISVRKGFETIYITGWGEDFIKKAIDVKKKVERRFVTVLRRYDYELEGRIRAVLLVCQSNLAYLAEQRNLQDEVKDAMSAVIPEIRTDEIQIVAIARIRDVGCKIAVKSVSEVDSINSVITCIGENGERLEELKSRFPHEFLRIVPWHDDPSVFIVNALAPLRRQYVDTVDLDEENHVANIKVKDYKACKRAIGKDGNNVNLAKELTGWLINIDGPRRSKIMNTPEDELKEVLIDNIPEINDNTIEIYALERIDGVGSKVVVRWKSGERGIKASPVCYGWQNERLFAIKRELFGEWIYFHEWIDDPEEFIIGCLYPLKVTDVKYISLDNEGKTAKIVLNNKNESPPIWRNHSNISLAESVTGWKIEIEENIYTTK